jgi:hypothetical protein
VSVPSAAPVVEDLRLVTAAASVVAVVEACVGVEALLPLLLLLLPNSSPGWTNPENSVQIAVFVSWTESALVDTVLSLSPLFAILSSLVMPSI